MCAFIRKCYFIILKQKKIEQPSQLPSANLPPDAHSAGAGLAPSQRQSSSQASNMTVDTQQCEQPQVGSQGVCEQDAGIASPSTDLTQPLQSTTQASQAAAHPCNPCNHELPGEINKMICHPCNPVWVHVGAFKQTKHKN